MKRCPRCGASKPLSDFSPDRARASGYSSRCKPCEATRSREYYIRTGGAMARARYQANRDRRLAQVRAWRQANPERVRELSRRQVRIYDPERARVKYMKRHGGIEEWSRMMQAQDGLCYLCGEPLEGTRQYHIHVDHDHNCCPAGKATESCSACRRGLAHAWCNQIIGLCGEDMSVLRAIVANFEPARDAAAERVAAKKAREPQLMPYLEMTEQKSWPAEAADALF